MRVLILFMLIPVPLSHLSAQVVELTTEKGKIVLKLYKDTPLHTANFMKNVKAGKYDGVLFHRVIKDFMIQGGEPSTKNAEPGKLVGGDTGKETVKAEISKEHYHKRGAVAAARQPDDTNPEKRSSQYQFYIVDGRDYTASMLNTLERNQNRPKRWKIADSLLQLDKDTIGRHQLDSMMKAKDYRDADKILGLLQERTDAIIGADNLFKFTAQQIIDYTSVGGVPNLDGKYTVFGEVISGMDVVDSISAVDTDDNSRPRVDIHILKAIVLEE